MIKGSRVDRNYLDYIPTKMDGIHWQEVEDGLIQIVVYRDSLFERIVRKIFSIPDRFRIDLDRVGSFVWIHIDGNRTIYDIARLIKDEFKDEVEPLYGRLIQYMNILKNNGFIDLL